MGRIHSYRMLHCKLLHFQHELSAFSQLRSEISYSLTSENSTGTFILGGNGNNLASFTEENSCSLSPFNPGQFPRSNQSYEDNRILPHPKAPMVGAMRVNGHLAMERGHFPAGCQLLKCRRDLWCMLSSCIHLLSSWLHTLCSVNSPQKIDFK